MPDRYIYAVYSDWSNGARVHRAKILREGPQRVRTGNTGLAFNCRQLHEVDTVHRSYDAAVDAYRRRLVEQIRETEQELVTLRREHARAQRPIPRARDAR